ncbi:MAG: hypothetical protein U0802_24920 [Candidatus Binatia bacterium]
MLRVPITIDAPGPFNAVDLTLALGPWTAPHARGAAAQGGRQRPHGQQPDRAPDRARVALASAEPLQPGGLLVLDLQAEDGAAADVRLLRALVDDRPAIATTSAARVQ